MTVNFKLLASLILITQVFLLTVSHTYYKIALQTLYISPQYNKEKKHFRCSSGTVQMLWITRKSFSKLFKIRCGM